MGIRIIGLLQVLCSLLIIAGIICGIVYMVNSKKTTGKKVFIGCIIILVPIILNFVLNIIKVNMILNMD